MRACDGCTCVCVCVCVYTSVCTNKSISTRISPIDIAIDVQTPTDIARNFGGEKNTASPHSPLPPCKLCRGAFAAGDVPACVCVCVFECVHALRERLPSLDAGGVSKSLLCSHTALLGGWLAAEKSLRGVWRVRVRGGGGGGGGGSRLFA